MVHRAVAAAVRTLDLGGRRVLVAVSGGVDSCVLLHALHHLSQDRGLNLLVGHVNHALRGAESEADQAFVDRLARELGLPFEAARADPQPLRQGGSSRARPTLQEAARRVRYEALRRMALDAGAERIATAHTADDQAETVLLRLLRGSGPDGLGGIPERSADGVIVRPLLRVPRAEVLAFARKRGLAWREDPSNRDPRFARNRLRTRWLPALRAEFNPRLLRAIGDLAEAQRSESEWLEGLTEREARRRFREDGSGLWIEIEAWDAIPDALARRLARQALRRCGAARDVSRVHLDRMVRFLRDARAGRRLELPGGLCLRRERARFRLAPRGLPPTRAC